MTKQTPKDLMETLVRARSENDIEAAVECYEADAIVIVEPGVILSGIDVIREFNKGVKKLGVVFSDSIIVEGTGVAMHYCSWSREDGATGETIVSRGTTTDLLRQQRDGSWLISIDNPWGTQVLERA